MCLLEGKWPLEITIFRLYQNYIFKILHKSVPGEDLSLFVISCTVYRILRKFCVILYSISICIIKLRKFSVFGVLFFVLFCFPPVTLTLVERVHVLFQLNHVLFPIKNVYKETCFIILRCFFSIVI